MIISIEVLSAAQCERVHATVHQLKNYWITRGQQPHPFYTLGIASYLDATRPGEEKNRYHGQVRQYNALLKEHFDWLYEMVSATLEQHLNGPVRYAADLALPGFHIWLSSGIITRPTASMHFDLQYLKHSWSDGDKPDFTKQISFTLPIRLPARDGGLHIWEMSYEEFLQAYRQGQLTNVAEIPRMRPMTCYPYTTGHLVLHSEHLLHQIAPTSEVQDSDERITLQGHGLLCNGQWECYW
jgi:hypothetical protein